MSYDIFNENNGDQHLFMKGSGKEKLLKFAGASLSEQGWVIIKKGSPAEKELDRGWNPASHGYKRYVHQSESIGPWNSMGDCPPV